MRALFINLEWHTPDSPDMCEWAEVDFPNGWRVTFLRGKGKNASIHMREGKSYYIGPYEACPWSPDGVPCPSELAGEWPSHGDADHMQDVMDLVAGERAGGK